MRSVKKLAAVLIAAILVFSLTAMAYATDSGLEARTLTLRLGKQLSGTEFHLQQDTVYSPNVYTVDDNGVLFLTIGDATSVTLVSEMSIQDSVTPDEDEEEDPAPVDATEGESAEDGTTAESESEQPTEEPTTEEKSDGPFGMGKGSLIATIIGVIIIGGYFLVDRLYLNKKKGNGNKRNNGGYDDDDDDYDE